MMALNLEQAAKDMGGAVDHLLGARRGDQRRRRRRRASAWAAASALLLAVERPDAGRGLRAVLRHHPVAERQPDWSKLQAPVRGHFAERGRLLHRRQGRRPSRPSCRAWARTSSSSIHPGVDHAFFNDTRPEVYDAEHSAEAWDATVAFFRETVK